VINVLLKITKIIHYNTRKKESKDRKIIVSIIEIKLIYIVVKGER